MEARNKSWWRELMKLARVINIARVVVVVTALGATLGCTTPTTMRAATIHAGDRCYRCGRVIADRSLAAEGIGPAGVVRKFRTLACMLKYQNQSNEQLDLLVTDARSGRFTLPEFASFVRTTIDERTGDQDYLAFREVWAAERLAARQSTRPMDWESVQASERAHSLAH